MPTHLASTTSCSPSPSRWRSPSATSSGTFCAETNRRAGSSVRCESAPAAGMAIAKSTTPSPRSRGSTSLRSPTNSAPAPFPSRAAGNPSSMNPLTSPHGARASSNSRACSTASRSRCLRSSSSRARVSVGKIRTGRRMCSLPPRTRALCTTTAARRAGRASLNSTSKTWPCCLLGQRRDSRKSRFVAVARLQRSRFKSADGHDHDRDVRQDEQTTHGERNS